LKAENAKSSNLAVAWSGLPWYAARLIKAGIERVGRDVHVLGTTPEMPMYGVEELLGRRISWLEKPHSYSWRELSAPTPSLFIHTGWNIPCFNSLADEVRRFGGAVISMIDNSYKGSLRQYVGAYVFRMRLQRRWPAVWVPGSSGKKLLRLFGMAPDSIYQGMYGADPETFPLGEEILSRPREILFVGQMIRRKGASLLVEAFRQSGLSAVGWRLRMIGRGPERPEFSTEDFITLEDFQDENAISRAMRTARIFVLPSYEEHWGVVLAEAGLSGCILVAANSVGAAADLITESNGCCFRRGDVGHLSATLRKVADWPTDKLIDVRQESRKLAASFGPKRWADEFAAIIARFAPNSR
jgi:glycosyltransferase involved in cell wall biosynthesis